MDTALGLWVLLSALGWVYAFFVYRRRELPVRGRWFLIFLRGAAIALLLLLLVDLESPFGGDAARRWILIDASPSMQVEQGGAIPLERAWASIDEDAAAVVTFGSPNRLLSPVPGDPMEAVEGSTDSRLAPALTRAVEAGAREIRVLTDLRIEDPVEVESLLEGVGASVRFDDLGDEVANVGIGDLVLPEAGRSADTLVGEARLFGAIEGPARVEASVAGQPVWDSTVIFEVGREEHVRFPVPLPDRRGSVVVALAVSATGDAHGADDRRSHVVDVDTETGELVLVSWTPDWEPRFLLPVLAEVTGLTPRGFLRVGDDRFLSMSAPVRVHTLAEVAAALEEARVGVAHAVPDDPGPLLTRAIARSPRLIVLPGSVGGGVEGGEWYPSNEIPPSPVAGEIAGIPLLGLPPLRGVREAGPGGVATLLVQRGGSGEVRPALVVTEEPGRRRAVGGAHGYWRWAFRDGPSRELYRRLWSGVASWLLADGATEFRETGLSPLLRVTAPDDAVTWRAGPAAGGSARVVFTRSPGDGPPIEHTRSVDSLGRMEVPAPSAPGTYEWEAEVESGPGEGVAASGLLVVEARDADLRPARATGLTDLRAGFGEGGSGEGRPLRTHPFPYLLLLGTLSAEWIIRRRSGLR